MSRGSSKVKSDEYLRKDVRGWPIECNNKMHAEENYSTFCLFIT